MNPYLWPAYFCLTFQEIILVFNHFQWNSICTLLESELQLSNYVTCAGHMVEFWDKFDINLDGVLKGLTSPQLGFTTSQNNQVNGKYEDEIYTAS